MMAQHITRVGRPDYLGRRLILKAPPKGFSSSTSRLLHCGSLLCRTNSLPYISREASFECILK